MKTKLHTYHYNCGVIPQSQAYLKLRDARMKTESRRDDRVKFVSTAKDRSGCVFSHLTLLSSDANTSTYEVDISAEHLFDDQWNTASTDDHSGYRVFDWVEYYDVHNKSAIWGHWLEVTDEMVAARQETKVCRYCWAMYGTKNETHLPGNPVFCEQCLGSPYLKETDLRLLRLVSVDKKHHGKVSDLTQDELDWLKPRYVEAQLRGSEERRKDKMAEQRDRLERERELDNMKHDGMKRLLDADLDLTNVIFYSHYPLFKFGWRDKLSPSVAAAIAEKLQEIGFPYPIDIASE
jgi:hypothetical protein